MVQSVGSPTDSYSLFQRGRAARTAAGGSASDSAFFDTTKQSSSSDATTTASASLADQGQTQTTSGDFANVFQRLSSALQSLMVQSQSTAGETGTSSSVLATTTPTTDDAATGTATTGDTTATSVGDAATQTDEAHHAKSGNRALQGDIDAMINDLHGFIQVANGDAMTTADNTTTASSANDNATTSASSLATDGTSSTDSSSTTASQAASESAAANTATNAVGDTTYAYAQTLMQALQNYSAASANASSSQPSAAVSAIG